MGSSIEIYCQKCHKRDNIFVGHGFMSASIDGTEITEDNKSFVQGFVPEEDRGIFEEVTRKKYLTADLHNGKEIYKCSSCAVFTDATRLVIRDKNHNVVYDAGAPKCKKCHKPMDLVEYSIEECTEPPFLQDVKCDLNCCLACGGEIKVEVGGSHWD